MPLYITRWSAWAPGIESDDDWKRWKRGELRLQNSPESPKLPFAPMLFKRRLSQLSRMVVQTGYSVLEKDAPAKITFASTYGELTRQLEISKQILDTGTVSPAHFSLSVFNAPVAALTILSKDTAGYAATFSGEHSFEDGLAEAASAILSESEESRIFIYGNENIPAEYAALAKDPVPPFAIAVKLSRISRGAIQFKDPLATAKILSAGARAAGTTPALLFLRDYLLPEEG